MKRIILLVLTLFIVVSSIAQQSTLKAERIVDNFIKIIGGQKALDEIETLYIKRILNHIDEKKITIQVAYQNRTGFERIFFPEDKNKSEIIINNQGTWKGIAKDSVIFWEQIPQMKFLSFIFSKLYCFADYQARGIKLNYVDLIEKNDKKLHHIIMTETNGQSQDLYFDNETGFWVAHRPNASTNIEVKEYKKYGDILFPTITEGRGTLPNGKEWHHINQILELKLNIHIDDNMFCTNYTSYDDQPIMDRMVEGVKKYLELNNNNKAIESIQYYKITYPDSAKVILQKIVATAIDLFKAGNRSSAIFLLEKLKPMYEKEVMLYNVLRQLYWYEFDREKCIENCQMTLKLDSTRVEAQRFLDILQFVPESFIVPDSLITSNLFIRPLRVSDAKLDYQAVMSSINHIRGVFGPDDDWPQETLTLQDDINALMNHENEHERRTAFTYTVMNHNQDKCFGCIYIIPIHSKQYDAQIFFWVTKEAYDLGYENELYSAIKNWLKNRWPFKKVIYPGRNMDWEKYRIIQY